ncbi:MAG: hypothetical protein IAE98_03095 [Candidatus Kapabacteria bacterium]|nr:hypothetical protein [Candidatus Kapabacteria bacterium]
MKVKQCFSWFIATLDRIINFLALSILLVIGAGVLYNYLFVKTEDISGFINILLAILFGFSTMCFVWASSLDAEIKDDNIKDKCNYKRMQATLNRCGRRTVHSFIHIIVAIGLNHIYKSSETDSLANILFIKELSGWLAFIFLLSGMMFFWICLRDVLKLSYDEFGND